MSQETVNLIIQNCDHGDGRGLQELYNFVLEKAKNLPMEYPFLDVGTRSGGMALLALLAIKESGKTERPLFTIDPYGDIQYDDESWKYGEDFYRTAMKTLSDYAYDNKLLYFYYRNTIQDFQKIFEDSSFWIDNKDIPKQFGCVVYDGPKNPECLSESLDWLKQKIVRNGGLVVDDISIAIRQGGNERYKKLFEEGTVVQDMLFWVKK
jgi:hypothetical protein